MVLVDCDYPLIFWAKRHEEIYVSNSAKFKSRHRFLRCHEGFLDSHQVTGGPQLLFLLSLVLVLGFSQVTLGTARIKTLLVRVAISFFSHVLFCVLGLENCVKEKFSFVLYKSKILVY